MNYGKMVCLECKQEFNLLTSAIEIYCPTCKNKAITYVPIGVCSSNNKLFKVADKEFRMFPYSEIKLPTRATNLSAGYDFYSPTDFVLAPKESIILPTDIKACGMNEDEYLAIHVRSSLGIKKKVMLMNTTGIIDSDYANNPDNAGNIHICLYNYGDWTIEISKGDKIVQGIFSKYYTTIDDKPISESRVGGIGSTGK